MRHINNLRFLALFLLSFLSIIISNAYPKEIGVNKNSIICGSYAPLTGPFSYGQEAVYATMSFFEYINETGGIHGRKIIYKIRDDQYIPSKAVSLVKALVERENIFAIVGGYGTATGLEVVPYIIQNEIPFIAPISLSYRFAYKKTYEYLSKYIFSLFTHNSTQAKLLVNYAIQELGAKRFGIVYSENIFGKEGLSGLSWAFKKNNLEPLAIVAHRPDTVDFSATILKLRKSNPEHVILWEPPFNASKIVNAAENINWNPRWLGNCLLVDPTMIKMAGKSWNNAINASLFPLIDSRDPGTEKFVDIIKRRNLPMNFLTQAGFAAGELFVEGLRRAGPNLNKENFISAMESIQNWNGFILRNISFSPKNRQGMSSVYFVKFSEGRYVKLSDWKTIIDDENGPPPP